MEDKLSEAVRLKIAYRATGSLTPYKNNARRHPRAQIQLLKKSLQTFGFIVPLIIDADGMILCGHGRFEAAKLLNMTSVPTIIVDHLSEEERRAYILMDNTAAERAGWDKDMVRTELQGLIDLGYDVELTGFTTLEIDGYLNIGDDLGEDEPPVEEPSAAAPVISRVGDLWSLGQHRVLCGDARLADSYEALLGGEMAQMTITDPPFNVKIAGNVSGLGNVRHDEFVMGSGELSDAAFEMQLLRPAFRNIARHSTAGAIAFIYMDWRGGRILQNAADGVFDEFKNLIVWAKTNAGMGSFYRSQHELVFAYKVSPGQHINNFGLGAGGRHRSNVWTYPGANTFRRGRKQDLSDHPTVKTRRMIADAILDCSKQGGIILDPFLGSGTTIVAAHKTGRRGFGMELDPRYCDVILRRIQAETGLEAMLGNKTLADVAAQRLREGGHD